MDKTDRATRTLDRLKVKIDPRGSYDFQMVPERPEGIHRAIYERKKAANWQAYEKREDAWEVSCEIKPQRRLAANHAARVCIGHPLPEALNRGLVTHRILEGGERPVAAP